MSNNNVHSSSQPLGIVKSEEFHNQQKTYPLVKCAYYHGKCLNNPQYWPTPKDGETYLFLDDRVVNNIMPERYMVSDLDGRIFDRSLNVYKKAHGNALKKADGTDNSYYKIQLAFYETPEKLSNSYQFVHRAVNLMFNYKQFAEDRELSGLETEHIDGNHANNSASNLRWVKHSENMNKAYSSGEMTNGSLIKKELPPHHVKQPINRVLSLIEGGLSNKEISKITGVNIGQVRDLRNGNTYKEYVKEYNKINV